MNTSEGAIGVVFFQSQIEGYPVGTEATDKLLPHIRILSFLSFRLEDLMPRHDTRLENGRLWGSFDPFWNAGIAGH